jgi:hypothetical protein
MYFFIVIVPRRHRQGKGGIWDCKHLDIVFRTEFQNFVVFCRANRENIFSHAFYWVSQVCNMSYAPSSIELIYVLSSMSNYFPTDIWPFCIIYLSLKVCFPSLSCFIRIGCWTIHKYLICFGNNFLYLCFRVLSIEYQFLRVRVHQEGSVLISPCLTWKNLYKCVNGMSYLCCN